MRAMLAHWTLAKRVFWESDFIIIQNLSDSTRMKNQEHRLSCQKRRKQKYRHQCWYGRFHFTSRRSTPLETFRNWTAVRRKNVALDWECTVSCVLLRKVSIGERKQWSGHSGRHGSLNSRDGPVLYKQFPCFYNSLLIRPQLFKRW